MQASGLREFTDIDPWVLGKLRGSASRISEGEPNPGLGRTGEKGFKLVGLVGKELCSLGSRCSWGPDAVGVQRHYLGRFGFNCRQWNLMIRGL